MAFPQRYPTSGNASSSTWSVRPVRCAGRHARNGSMAIIRAGRCAGFSRFPGTTTADHESRAPGPDSILKHGGERTQSLYGVSWSPYLTVSCEEQFPCYAQDDIEPQFCRKVLRIQGQRVFSGLGFGSVAEGRVNRFALEPVMKLVGVVLAAGLARLSRRDEEDGTIPIRK